jgi:thiamine kinase-like enzyme
MRAEAISPLLSGAAHKRCFRIDLADGRTVKLRRSTSEQEARQYAELVFALADPRLARVLGRRGDITLEEWVPGTELTALEPSPAHVAAGGELLGTLHAARDLGAIHPPSTVSTGAARDQLESDLDTILRMGAIPGQVGERLRRRAAAHDPGSARAGILHTDLCPENLVLDPDGVIRAIDNEGMRIGATGFDLARTWYRWPMSTDHWRLFISTYARHADPAEVLAPFPFWQIAAVAQSACLRLTRETAHADLPVRYLAGLSED